MWTNIILPPKEQSPDLKHIKLKLQLDFSAIFVKLIKCAWIQIYWISMCKSFCLSFISFLPPILVYFAYTFHSIHDTFRKGGSQTLWLLFLQLPPMSPLFFISCFLSHVTCHSQSSLLLCLPVHLFVSFSDSLILPMGRTVEDEI